MVEIRQSMLEGDYEKLRTNRMISVENYKMASILTHTDIKEEDLPEGDEIDMCEGMKRRRKTRKENSIIIIESKIRKCTKSTRTSNTK